MAFVPIIYPPMLIKRRSLTSSLMHVKTVRRRWNYLGTENPVASLRGGAPRIACGIPPLNINGREIGNAVTLNSLQFKLLFNLTPGKLADFRTRAPNFGTNESGKSK